MFFVVILELYISFGGLYICPPPQTFHKWWHIFYAITRGPLHEFTPVGSGWPAPHRGRGADQSRAGPGEGLWAMGSPAPPPSQTPVFFPLYLTRLHVENSATFTFFPKYKTKFISMLTVEEECKGISVLTPGRSHFTIRLLNSESNYSLRMQHR